MSEQLSEAEGLEMAGIAWAGFDHCDSCHDDSDYGYAEMPALSLKDGRYVAGCCEALEAIEKADAGPAQGGEHE